MTGFLLLQDPDLAPVLAALPSARLVGGCVRDMLAGVPIADIDLATPDAPEIVMQALSKAGLRALPTGLSHGTVTALSGGKPFEITTLRRDVETDGRHAIVAWTGDWRADAARRDFTINAMSLDRNGQLHDFFGGRDDLHAGRVRFVGDAALRIAEDELRILRFFRFFGRYGHGPPDHAAVAAIAGGLGDLAKLSPERVWSELKRIFAIADPSATLTLMRDLGVLDSILPEAQLPDHLPPVADPLLRLASMLRGHAGEVAARLRFSTAEQDRLAALLDGPVAQPGDDDAVLSRLLADEPAETLIDRTWLEGPGWQELRARLAALAKPVFPLEGRDALALGASPGPHIGEALRHTRERWLTAGCTADRAQCLLWLEARLEEVGALPPDTMRFR